MRPILCAASLAVLALAHTAQAETLELSGIYPAANDEAAALESITVERFGGDLGASLAMRIEDELRQVDVDGRPWLRILPARGGGEGEGYMTGTAYGEGKQTRFTKEREECVRQNQFKQCEEKKKVQVQCTRRTLELDVALRLVRSDGTLVYSSDRPERYEDSRCEGDSGEPRERTSVERELIGRVATRVRFDIAPVLRRESIRIDENRKGLSKADGERFKAAVRLTKADQEAACAAFESLRQDYPGHVPTLSNLGLCAERVGRDNDAAALYRRVQASEPRNSMARTGLGRIAERDRARVQLAAHYAR